MTLFATAAQRELWHLDQYAGTGSTLNVPAAWRITGDLDATALATAVDTVVARHESLRTAFRPHDDGPILEVGPAPTGSLTTAQVTDPSELPDLVRRFHAAPFDLTTGRPAAALLVRSPDGEHLLALSIHHTAVDAWSLGIIEAELGEAYRIAVQGVAPDRTVRHPLGAAVRELAARQQSPQWEEALNHWRSELHGLPGAPALPGALGRDSRLGFDARRIRCQLPSELRSRLTGLSRALDATVFQLLAAAYVGVLGRWANCDDFVIGVPVADRVGDTLQSTVLFATNVAPIRVRLGGNPDFAGLVDQVRRRLTSAITHSVTPLSEILRVTGSGSGEDVASLAALAITYRNRPGRGLRLDGLSCQPYRVEAASSLYQLACHVEQDDEALWLEIEGRAFGPEDLEGLWQRLLAALDLVTRRPDTALADWPTLLSTDRRPAPAVLPAPAGTVVDAFLRNAAELPQHPAVIDRHGQVTYWQLRRQAQAVATHLAERGARPGEAVAVCVRRGAGTLAALLGVMLAGCVYLPVDPEWPTARMRTVLDDAGVRQVVHDVETAFHPGLAGRTGTPAWSEAAPTAPTAGRPGPDGPAYLLYTSGSTGQPKGVLVRHAALTRLIAVMRGLAVGTSVGRVLATTTITFDISLVELLLPMTTGATCVIADEETVRDPMLLARWITEQRIDFAQATPTLWSALLEQLDAQIPLAVTAGEPLSAELRDRLVKATGRAFNGYGPTEATIYATVWPLEPGCPVSIGTPVEGTAAWVLDRWGRPCATGAVGQLYLGGEGLAEGYLNRPELTEERFPDHLPAVTAERVYATGDLASWGKDGLLYLHGREDHQIKLRGFRIELGEVESVLTRAEGVAAATVVPYTRGEGQQGLAAFVRPVAPRADGLLAPAVEHGIRELLAGELPEYMRPRLILPVDELPVTGSGKTDRGALVQLAEAGAHREAEDQPPATPLHAQVSALWSELLGIIGPGDHESFFDLGGDSLGAARLVARLRKNFGITLPLRTFVKNPTVDGIVRLIHAEERGSVTHG
ncbi:non-ribosomal peptide synthetase [Kitasatospora cineracea]|uniref:non-ribosomal peptide synthetase n=1 Tax=Kitasatospora cineracea TaxID=88074 RepID=UPI0033DAE1EF